MGSRRSVALAVACLVVIAGCSGFIDGPAGDEEVETVTPVPLSTTTDATPTPHSDRPPGVFANGTVHVDRLVSAHTSYVANRSYTWRFRYTVTATNGSVERNMSRQVTVDTENLLVEQTTPSLSQSQSLYVDDVGYLRTIQDGEKSFKRVVEPQEHRVYAFTDGMIERFLTGVTVDVAVVDRGGQTYYRLHTADRDVPSRLNEFGPDVWNYSMTAYVTPDGFVRTVAVDYRRARDGGQHVTTRYDYSAVGSTNVTEADWVSQVTPTPTPAPATTTTPTAATTTETTASATTAPTSTPTPSENTTVTSATVQTSASMWRHARGVAD